MWDKKYDQATWNGIPFSILKTDDTQGKHVDAKEIPYSDSHYHDVLGDKIPTYTIEAVFVGADSLNEANAFRSELRQNPEGTLEHPYLGELDLVYEDSTQSINTKKGLVKLTLKFITQGKPVELPKTFSKSLTNYSDPVINQANIQFENQINAASVDQITITQNEFDTYLNDIDYLANQLKLDGSGLDVKTKINAAKRSISSIATNPGEFAGQIDGVMNSLVSGVQTSYADTASNSILSLEQVVDKRFKDNEENQTTPLIKLHSTTARLKLNRALAAVSDSTDLNGRSSVGDLTNKLNGINLETAYQSIKAVKSSIEQRYQESTSTADYETMPLVEAIANLNNHVQTQLIKLNEYLETLQTISIYSPTPSICLAFANDSTLSEFEGLNAITHPLFVHGEIKVKK
ncbi:DNA circularization N-terminal domain-containing protein [Thiomicrorhabdus sp.]|uniref:DNA circularization N-terminal domain-containing protein n=1 Tax=Thiomicrorhabdus sp. TaxID=2039724 RepID=UPI0035622F73